MSVYRGDWKSWADVSEAFRDYGSSSEYVLPEPEEVLLAEYERDGYKGSAVVIYRKGEKFYLVEADHCSCNGFEGRWRPEEYESREQLIMALEKGYHFFQGEALDRLRQ